MRVTEKGQVTIPKAIRDKLGIVPGSEVDFVDEGDVVRFVRTEEDAAADLRVQRMRQWINRVKGSADSGMTTDEIMDITRDRHAHPDR